MLEQNGAHKTPKLPRSTTGASTTGMSCSTYAACGRLAACFSGWTSDRCWIPASILDVDPERASQVVMASKI